MTGEPSNRIVYQRSSAFTLIETISVMMLVSILAIAAVPVVNTIGRARTAAAAAMVFEDVSFARRRAIATGLRQWIVFDVANDSWSLMTESAAAPGRGNATVLVDPSTSQPMTSVLGIGDYVNVAITLADFDGNAEIGFDWQGRPLNSAENDLAAQGSVTIDTTHQVLVELETGHVRLVVP